MKSSSVWRVLILTAWLALMGWYIRYEAYPGYFTRSLSGYRDLLDTQELFADSWTRIMYRDQPIGFSHTSVQIDEEDPLSHYRIESRSMLQLQLMGERQQVNVQTMGALDALQRLQRFEFSMQARRYSMTVTGERTEGERFRVVVRSDLGKQEQIVRIPDDVVLYSPMTEMKMGRLNPGDELTIKTLDPTSMSTADVLVKAVKRVRISNRGNEVDALELETDYRGMLLRSWVDGDGRMLRQETPLGWSMESCESAEALSLPVGTGSGLDLIESAAVKVIGAWPESDRAPYVRIACEGVAMRDFAGLDNERQDILALDSNRTVVLIRRGSWFERSTFTTGDWSRADLESTAFIQSDHPDIQKRALALTQSSSTVTGRVDAIFDWVHRHMRKQAVVSMPSALDVLNRMEGDCNEHAYLFVALARAAGIPAQVRIGLLQKDGSLYYHAWAAVYADGWCEVDPTTGQAPVGLDHLTLLRGELEHQMQLMPLFGRLRVRVLPDEEAHHD